MYSTSCRMLFRVCIRIHTRNQQRFGAHYQISSSWKQSRIIRNSQLRTFCANNRSEKLSRRQISRKGMRPLLYAQKVGEEKWYNRNFGQPSLTIKHRRSTAVLCRNSWAKSLGNCLRNFCRKLSEPPMWAHYSQQLIRE